AQILKEQQEKVHFLLMGYPNVHHYRALAQRKNVSDIVTFTGKMPYRSAPDYLSVGDIAIAPKMSTTEGSGKLLNYMAMAQPVVAYDSPVHREYLSEWGVYAPSGNVEQFAAAIRALIHNPTKRAYLGEKLRQRAVKTYSWQKAGERIEQIYRELTKMDQIDIMPVRIQ
ncbi:MAG: glycosyltransferase, partial [Chloroflexi bacterium]|nr:glycosyltransferase [Chloroflexota bacterium]